MAKKDNATAPAVATPKKEEVKAEVVETTTEEATTEGTVETTTEEATTEGTVETATEEVTTEETVETATEVKTLPNREFEVKGKKYKLSDRCPAKVQIDGEVYSREDLLNNKEILQYLVIGESAFVKKV